MTLNEVDGPMRGLCRDCDIEDIFARTSCRGCLAAIMREIFAGPGIQQHAPGCALREDPDCFARTDAELEDVRERRARGDHLRGGAASPERS